MPQHACRTTQRSRPQHGAQYQHTIMAMHDKVTPRRRREMATGASAHCNGEPWRARSERGPALLHRGPGNNGRPAVQPGQEPHSGLGARPGQSGERMQVVNNAYILHAACTKRSADEAHVGTNRSTTHSNGNCSSGSEEQSTAHSQHPPRQVHSHMCQQALHAKGHPIRTTGSPSSSEITTNDMQDTAARSSINT